MVRRSGRSSDTHHPAIAMRRILLIAHVAALIILLTVVLRIDLWPLLLVAFGIHMTLLYANLHSTCQWLGPVITDFPTERKEVWLTIDDGPDPGETPATLEILRKHDAIATFFVIGEKAAENPSLIRAIKQNGNDIGNHSHSHPASTGWMLGEEALKREIGECDRVLESITGTSSDLYRSPIGHKPWHLHKVLREKNKSLVAWSVRTGDGRRLNARELKTCLKRIESALCPGAIFVLHESKGHGPRLLESVLRMLNEHGYKTVLPDSS